MLCASFLLVLTTTIPSTVPPIQGTEMLCVNSEVVARALFQERKEQAQEPRRLPTRITGAVYRTLPTGEQVLQFRME